MTIRLPDHLESSIREAVDGGRFASVEDAMAEAARLLLRQLERQRESEAAPAGQEPSAEAPRPIWEMIEEENRSIPPEVWADLPVDLAAQHDHYVYGTPKRADA